MNISSTLLTFQVLCLAHLSQKKKINLNKDGGGGGGGKSTITFCGAKVVDVAERHSRKIVVGQL